MFGPGRHPPSESVFLYFLDPDGLTLEYSFGMEEFPERESAPAAAVAAGTEVDRLLGCGAGTRLRVERRHRAADDMSGLNGKIGIVTGAGSGIGGVIARRLHADGMKLMVADVVQANVDAMVRELGGDTIGHVGDLSVEAVVRDMIGKTKQHFGAIDVLVNNAGGGVIRPFLEHTAETLHQTLNRNLWTTLWCCHAVLPVMLRAAAKAASSTSAPIRCATACGITRRTTRRRAACTA